jgi:hydroxymethylpyrimidine pyrophosphatase-like HAD family hydrolase
VTDLDGTLFDAKRGVTEYAARVLGRCRRAGIRLAFATARPARAAAPYAAALSPDYILAAKSAADFACGACGEDGVARWLEARLPVKGGPGEDPERNEETAR